MTLRELCEPLGNVKQQSKMQLQELTDIDRVHWQSALASSGRCEWTLVSFCSSLGTCVCVCATWLSPDPVSKV